MFVIIGCVVVLASVLIGFTMHGGPLGVLLQYNEFVIIGGASIGSMLVGTPLAVLKKLAGSFGSIFKGDPYTKEEYLSLLKSMYELFNVATRDGLINVESHIENPEKSPIFSKNPFLLKQHHALWYLCDTMKLLLGGGVAPHDLEAMLDADIEAHHAEQAPVAAAITKMSDALPGLGIVAAVLGIVITMQAINGPPEVIGEKVAAALVGTFLGILMCYGFVGPLAGHLEQLQASESRYFECIKAGVVAYAKGNAPITVVEFARRSICGAVRPSFKELETAARSVKAAPAGN
ncbi:MAG: flagellar motor stator protein MotA [Ignavibacteriales bacterium]|nr:flagellar motor stator protein MotA [Ignavibacteriales bacterium]